MKGISSSRREEKTKEKFLRGKTFGAKTTTKQVRPCSQHSSISTATDHLDAFASGWDKAPL